MAAVISEAFALTFFPISTAYDFRWEAVPQINAHTPNPVDHLDCARVCFNPVNDHQLVTCYNRENDAKIWDVSDTHLVC